jgi:hypothetical protein
MVNSVGGEMVTIWLVGNGGPMKQIIHESVILTSKYLKEHLAAWKPSPLPPAVRVGWSGPNVWDMYEHWLYSRQVLTTSELHAKARASDANFLRGHFVDLLAAWCFGQTIADVVFQDMVMSALAMRLRSSSGQQSEFIYCLIPKLVVPVYGRTTEGSPIRILVADAVARFDQVHDFHNFYKDPRYSMAFIKDLMLAMVAERDRQIAISTLQVQDVDLKDGSAAPNTAPTHCTPTPQGPSSILKNGVPKSSSEPKRVKFKLHNFAPDECVYHLHAKSGRACWREKMD